MTSRTNARRHAAALESERAVGRHSHGREVEEPVRLLGVHKALNMARAYPGEAQVAAVDDTDRRLPLRRAGPASLQRFQGNAREAS